MRTSLQLKLGPQLSMTPQLQQAIRLLQYSSLELRDEIQTLVESNTFLEIEEPEVVSAWGDPMVNTLGHTHSLDDDSFQENFLQRTSELPCLKAHLRQQVHLQALTEIERLILTHMIDNLSDDGYFLGSLEEFFHTLPPTLTLHSSMEHLEYCLQHLQQCEPAGVGARTLSECLSIQLHAHFHEHPHYTKAQYLVQECLEYLGKHEYIKLNKRLKWPEATFSAAIKLILSLEPKPGRHFSTTGTEYITPDVLVSKHAGRWIVELNALFTPKVRVNPSYTALIKRADTSRDNQFLKEQFNEARFFLKSLQNRNETLLKVATCIVKRQCAFLEQGEEAMQPLVLQDIAEELQLHESTISRITTRKYIYVPQGIYELKFFFSSHVTTSTGGECSATAIRAFIKKIIAEESRARPISDQYIADLLSQQGICIARRTVAKYREALSIRPSHERKSYSC
jgi:RNA polymerase sigma-54 factor